MTRDTIKVRHGSRKVVVAEIHRKDIVNEIRTLLQDIIIHIKTDDITTTVAGTIPHTLNDIQATTVGTAGTKESRKLPTTKSNMKGKNLKCQQPNEGQGISPIKVHGVVAVAPTSCPTLKSLHGSLSNNHWKQILR